MFKSSLLIFIFAVFLAISSCAVSPKATTDELVLAQATPSQQEPCKPSTKHVEFENVSFDYDPCAFGDVKAEKSPEFRLQNPTDKPDNVAPEHIYFGFESGPKYWEPTLEIYPVQRFPSMYSVNTRLVKDCQTAIQDLEKAIKHPGYRVKGQIPYIPFIDAGQDFQAHVKSSPFSGGEGIYFVTYLDTEVILINNDHLRYVFEGLTSDGRYYVLAEIPISLSYLDEVTQNVEGASLEGFTYDDLIEMLRTDEKDRKKPKYLSLKSRYDSYISAVTSRVEQTKPEDFVPSLIKLEELIASLKIAN